MAKLLINSTISTPGAMVLGINLTTFYINTPMLSPEYMCLCLDIIPNKIIIHYNLCDIVTPGGPTHTGSLATRLVEHHFLPSGR
jgi:hypothetical protein